LLGKSCAHAARCASDDEEVHVLNDMLCE
jgi:hypothetical protein